MPIWIITFFLGVCALLFCRTLPSWYWVLILVPSVFIWLISKEGSKKLFQHVLIFLLGFSWCLIYVHWITSWRLPHALEGKNLLITGYIASQPVNKARRVSFEFRVENWDQTIWVITSCKTGSRHPSRDDPGQKHVVAGCGQTPRALTPQKIKLKLTWYGDHPDLKAGDRWQLLVRLKRPYGTLNPGGFDVEKYLLVHRIRARGYVVKSELNQILSSKLYNYPFARLRQFLIHKLERSLKSDSLAPIITAFVTGFESRITKSQWKVLRDSGTSYLVAISGLHIGLVATIIFILFGFLWKRFYRLPLILPARDAGIIA